MDYIEAVQTMQDYIKLHFSDPDFNIENVCFAVGYSRRHADRLFKQYLGKTLQEYVNAVYLSQGADELANTQDSVLNIALKSHFQSHEGFTRSFCKRFHITPAEYRKKQIPIPLFIQYPISHYESLFNYKEDDFMNDQSTLCMVTPNDRPQRKLIHLPSQKAEDYFTYCEEMGCEWEGLLNSIPEKFDTAALIELPEHLIKDGASKIAAGVEVPMDFDKPLPAEYECVVLPECVMLYFQSEPYEDEQNFCQAIECTYAAIAKYQPETYGFRLAYDIAPSFNFGAETTTGARLAVPAVRL